ncbi:hypothetical protein PMZ80_007168 [Knufia obscura]|uniref:FAD-binding domain-containing protein n=1 Tax=Knufia obscura TaxID=1635080 RepID=A0ABR0RJF6_9EURO|nr:hypothetical protein PMZ80_007168 [Knufia obscura]
MSEKEGRKLDILVSGAGIAGLTAAHFLLRAGHNVLLIERAPALRASGQNVDVRGHGLTVLQRMNTPQFNAESAVRAKTTEEKGLRFVDAADRPRAEFPVDDGTSFTGEIEIMRGDLALVLYESIKHMSGLKVEFGIKIEAIDQSNPEKVAVGLNGSWPSDKTLGTRKFDLVIAADGIMSSTRRLVFQEAAMNVVKPLSQWSCWFSIPWEESDSAWARWYNAPKGRMILIRPDSGNLTRVSLWTMTRDPEVERSLTELLGSSMMAQKQYWVDLFQGAGWEASRVLDGIDDADDFYMQKIAQVKMDSWSNDRVVLVGDAGYCPSPVSGMGVTTAMTGAYVLAGEINHAPENVQAACKAYEDKMRPFTNVAQKLAPGTPGAANPETAWGIWLLYFFLGFVSSTRLYKLFGSGINPPSQAMKLPDYGI